MRTQWCNSSTCQPQIVDDTSILGTTNVTSRNSARIYYTSDMQNMVWGEPERVQNGIGSVCLCSTD